MYKYLLILLIFISCTDKEINYQTVPNNLELKIPKLSKDTFELLTLISDLNDTLIIEAFKTKVIKDRNLYELKFNKEFLTEVLENEIIPIYFQQIDSVLNIDFKNVQNEHSLSLNGTKFEIKIDSSLQK